jgi:hypothetical protein
VYRAWRTIARWPYVSAAAFGGVIVLIGLVLLAQQQTGSRATKRRAPTPLRNSSSTCSRSPIRP